MLKPGIISNAKKYLTQRPLFSGRAHSPSKEGLKGKKVELALLSSTLLTYSYNLPVYYINKICLG